MGVGGVGGRCVTAAGHSWEDMSVSVPDPTPNQGLRPTASSLRYVAAFGRCSGLALGCVGDASYRGAT
jgi:hypothetical protein